MNLNLANNALIYNEISSSLAEGCLEGYRAGLASVTKLNKKNILKLDDKAPLFKISYTDADKLMLKNFEAEALTVAGVLSYECEERLKERAVKIINGEHPYLKANPESSIDDLWRDEAYNILCDYIEVEDMPPPGILKVNLKNAINSSYHAARYQRVQELKDVYPYYQYKTQNDSLVRKEHAALHDKIFAANDPVWQIILPPNGYGCRCYFIPLTLKELDNIDRSLIVNIFDNERREELIKTSNITLEFKRNSATTKSIWGKWLQSKLKGIDFDVVTKRMSNNINKMPGADKLIGILESKAVEFREIKYSRASLDKEFPEDKINTPLGEFKFGEDFFNKFKRRGRQNLLGLVKPTLENPEFIFIDAENGTLFLKAFKKNNAKIYVGILKNPLGRDTNHISFYLKENLINKLNNGKLMVYSREKEYYCEADLTLVPASGTAGNKIGFAMNFADVETNIIKLSKKSNEIWYEFISPGKTNEIVISYSVDGFYYSINGKTQKFDSYANIGARRKGVIKKYSITEKE